MARYGLQVVVARSLLNPLWYAGAFSLGLLAGRMGDAVSLGFVVETETQVAAHLQSHLDRLPEQDQASRAVVARMKQDEERHADQARAAGAMQDVMSSVAAAAVGAAMMARAAAAVAASGMIRVRVICIVLYQLSF